MKTTYLKDFAGYAKKRAAFVPLGTIEWHGNHLPIETDFLVAQKICEILAKIHKGYILPPIYLGSDGKERIGNKELIGMDVNLGKRLPGSLYYMKPSVFFAMVESLVLNLIGQGFTKIYLVSGHGGSKQLEVLEKVAQKYKEAIFLDPYDGLSVDLHHADEYETSLLWACCPAEMQKGMRIRLQAKDDYVKYRGYNPLSRASLKIGKKILNEMISSLTKLISRR